MTTSPSDSEEELQALVNWYKGLSEDYKRYVAFRAERVQEEWAIAQLAVYKAAERAIKLLRK